MSNISFSGRNNGVRYAFAVLIVAVAYVIFAKIGFSLAFSVRQVTAVWPPSGIAVVALLLGGLSLWPGVMIGAFVANLMTHEAVHTALGISVGNTLGPLLAAYCLRRSGLDPRLERVNDVLRLAVFGPLAMIVTATNGVLWLASAGIVSWHEYGVVWRTWWDGDAMGVLLFAPFLLTWIESRDVRVASDRTIEIIIFPFALLLVAWLGFLNNLRLGFLVFPAIIWSGLRFRQRVTSTAVILVSLVAIIGTKHEIGPFAGGTLDQRLAYLMTLMAVLSVTGLILGAVTSERETADEMRQDAERRELENATEIARTLQGAFLPKRLPEHREVTFDALYLTAGREALVGGDWYDAFTIPDGHIVVSIGDMLGHGVSAAVTAAEIRQRILATAFSTTDPAEILEKVNRTLRDEEQTIATALVAFIDPKGATMRLASAGHPPPIIAGPTIPARFLAYGGLPLGVLADSDYETHSIVLEENAAVLFYTDGVTEFNRNIEAAEFALLAAIDAFVSEPLANPAAIMQRRVMGTSQPVDDVVLMVVRLAPSPVRAGAIAAH
ncbi:MAG TPA: MASE1 domain-containing protein [Candidatus Acidoferrales bacterium]|nr:MASE1 domain-containing protein [Candidatus Acidoferrales bacterium]